MKTMRRIWAGLVASHLDGHPIPAVCWDLADREDLKYRPMTTRSSWHTIGTMDEVYVEALGLEPVDEHTGRVQAEDDMWDMDHSGLEFSQWERFWLQEERVKTYLKWLEFVASCSDPFKLRIGVSKLNRIYHRSRRLCEGHGKWDYIYLDADQYEILRVALWEKINTLKQADSKETIGEPARLKRERAVKGPEDTSWK